MRCTVVALALVALVALVGCHRGPSGAEDAPIQLGAALQITGPLANTGRYYRDGYQIAVEQINAKGGITVAGHKRQLALKLLDNQSDVNLGVRQYVQLLSQDKVDFLLGPFSSNDALNDSSVAEKYEVPMVQGGGASSQIFSRGYRYIFGTLPPADNYFDSTLKMMMKLPPRPPKTAALVCADDSFDVSVAQGTRKLLAAAGIELVVDKQYPEHTPEFSSILSLIKSQPPDIILWSGHEPQALSFLRQAKSLGVDANLAASYTVGVPAADFRKALGKDAELALGMTPWIPSKDLKDDWFGDGESFARAYEQKFGYAPDYHAASAVADVEVFAKAIEAAGSLDRARVRDAIAGVDFHSLYGQVKFGATGQIALPELVVQIQNGQVVPIYAEDFINKPVYPVPAWDKR